MFRLQIVSAAFIAVQEWSIICSWRVLQIIARPMTVIVSDSEPAARQTVTGTAVTAADVVTSDYELPQPEINSKSSFDDFRLYENN